jgi:transcriptional regulator with XRE-family HTH domain
MREEAGLSQAQLARESGVDRATINKIEQGKRSPSIATLESLSRTLAVEMADFFPKAQAPLPDLEDEEERRLSRFSEAIIAAAARWGEAMSSPDMNDTKRFGLIDAALDLSRVIEERAEEEDWEALPNQERLEIVTTMEKLIEAANQGLRHLEESGMAKAQEELVDQRREQMREWTRRISA